MDHPEVVLLVDSKRRCHLRIFPRWLRNVHQNSKPSKDCIKSTTFRTLRLGEYAGLYLWKSPEALAEFRDSELRASIAAAYQIEGEPRVEVYRVAKTLREEIA
jgi:hypothetical protein